MIPSESSGIPFPKKKLNLAEALETANESNHNRTGIIKINVS